MYSKCEGHHLDAVSLFSNMFSKDIDFNQTTLSRVLKSVASLQDNETKTGNGFSAHGEVSIK